MYRRALIFVAPLLAACGGATSVTADPIGDPDGAMPTVDAGSDATKDGAHDGKPDAPAPCPKGMISFQLDIASGDERTYCTGSGCDQTWLSVSGAVGSVYTRGGGCGDTDCATCQTEVVYCGACAPPAVITSGESVHSDWDGTYSVGSTCGNGTHCTDQACAPAGRYVATFCGDVTERADACPGTQTPTCTKVEFDWPPAGGTATVRGVIGQPTRDGGGVIDAAND